MKTGGAIRASHGMGRADGARERRLEGLDPGAGGEEVGLERLGDGGDVRRID